MTRTDIINSLIEKYNYIDYLEIGVDKCDNYLHVRCKNKECVDPFIHNEDYTNNKDIYILDKTDYYIYDFIEKNILTNKMDSDTFFEFNHKKYDIIFIDGDHREEQVTKDIYNALQCLNDNGSILLHDTLPWCAEVSYDERTTRAWTGSVYKSIVKLNTLYEGIEYYTIDTDMGCCLIRKKKNFRVKCDIKDIDDVFYEEIFNKPVIRNAALNVISVEEFNNLLYLE